MSEQRSKERTDEVECKKPPRDNLLGSLSPIALGDHDIDHSAQHLVRLFFALGQS